MKAGLIVSVAEELFGEKAESIVQLAELIVDIDKDIILGMITVPEITKKATGILSTMNICGLEPGALNFSGSIVGMYMAEIPDTNKSSRVRNHGRLTTVTSGLRTMTEIGHEVIISTNRVQNKVEASSEYSGPSCLGHGLAIIL